MKKIAFILLLLILTSTIAVPEVTVNHSTFGDGQPNPRTVNITYDGKERQYMLYLPSNYNHTRSADGIIVCCHGFGGKMANALARFQYIANNSNVNMICIAPQALPEEDESLQSTASSIGYDLSAVWGQVLHAQVKLFGLITIADAAFNKDVDDIVFIRHLIQNTVETYNANPDNVFIGGISMGGYMAYAYALRHGDELAGVINYTGTMNFKADTVNVVENIKVPILDFHSKEDATVFYEGEGYYAGGNNIWMKNGMSKLTGLDWWARKNGATSTPVITDMGIHASNVKVKKYYYDHADYEITHFQMEGANATHSYVITGGAVNHGTEVREFILRHKSPNKPMVSYDWLLAPAIAVEENTVRVVGPDGDRFSEITIDGVAGTDLSGINAGKEVTLEATDGTQVIRLKIER